MYKERMRFRLFRYFQTVADTPGSDFEGMTVADTPGSDLRGRMLCASALLAVFLLAGCHSPDRAKIVGQWKIAEASKLSQKIGGAEDSDSDDSKMTIHFDRSGKLRTDTSMGNIKSTKQGTWRFLGYDEPKGQMQIECTLGMQTTEHDIEFQNDDTIVWIPPNLAGTSQKVRFIRAKN